MNQKLILFLALIVTAPAFSNPTDTEVEAKAIANELTKATNEIQKDFDQNNEEALYSFNLDKKLDPIYTKAKSFYDRHPDLKGKFKVEGDRLNLLLDKVNEQHTKGRAAAKEAAINALNKAEKSLRKTEERNNTKDVSSENVSYDEWFTLQRTGIKSGKKYSFIACVNGARNATAIQCSVPGSAAKRVFYNTDDIKDIEAKKKWVNTINENKCVTAYVTGGEAFIVDLKDQNACK